MCIFRKSANFAVMKRILGILLLVTTLFSSCRKVPAADVAGSWQAVHEDWTVVTDGNKTTASYDISKDPADDFTVMQLLNSSFIVMSSTNLNTAEKFFTMYYSDRFSPLTVRSARLRYGKIKSGNASWVIRSVDEQEMVVDYDSGKIDADGSVIRRQAHIVFQKTWDKVIRQ